MRGPVTLLNDSGKLLKEHLRLFISIYAVPLLLVAVLGIAMGILFPAYDSTSVSIETKTEAMVFLVFFLLTLVVSILGTLALLRAVIEPVDTTFKKAYEYALKGFFPFLLLSLMVGITTSVGFMLLLIPGIIFSVWFAFSQ